MTDYTATTLAYVRTSAGVVKVATGEDVPRNALPSEVGRLAKAGVLVEATTITVEVPAMLEAKPGSKPALVAQAQELGLDTTGTKAELAARIAAVD